MISERQAAELQGAKVVDVDGHKVGSVGRIYLDDSTGQPAWVTVSTGFLGGNETFVPLSDATLVDGDVRVPYTKGEIKEAPTIDVDRHLEASQEEELYRYYGLVYGGGRESGGPARPDTAEAGQVPAPTGDLHDADAPAGPLLARTERDVDSGLVGPDLGAGSEVDLGTAVPTAVAEGEDLEEYEARTAAEGGGAEPRESSNAQVPPGDGASSSLGDDAMTRSEERLRTGTERVPAGKARLRRWVETETVQVEVPVRREKARLEVEPGVGSADRLTDGAAAGGVEPAGASGRAVAGGPEIVLHEERPVVTTETVPVERVRLGTEEVEETVTVSDDVQVERVALETDTGERRQG
jgi:stress response protein YsnF/sporulation protein YlmC with PRC-barrel domain